MNKNLILSVSALSTAMLFTACIDNAYDLSDIDTTSRINVNNLVIPVNIDKITLDDIITFDETSKIQPVTIDGQQFYALTETGSFESDPIEINKVIANKPSLPSTTETLDRTTMPQFKSRRAPSNFAVSYKITEMGDIFSYEAHGIDKAIKELTSAKVNNITFGITVTAQNLASVVEQSYFSNIVIQLPKGLSGNPSSGTYNPKNGQWTIPYLNINGTSTGISFIANAIDLSANDCILDPEAATFSLTGAFKILNGVITLEPKIKGGVPETLPSSISFRADYNMSNLEIEALSGTIEYDFDGLNINPVNLTDIPDFLSCEGTNILLANPQIYLNLNNPLAQYKLTANTGLTLTAKRPVAPEGLKSLSYSLDSPIVIDYSGGANASHQFVLAPSNLNLNVPEGYNKNNLNFTPFTQLSDVLAVPANNTGYTELPETIEINLSDAKVPRQKVEDFELGVKLQPVVGSYDLIAPLALKEGSLIIYSETEDGWNDEDVDAITIEALTLTATADNATPLDAELVAYPIDVEGNRIKNVKITSNILKANTTGTPIEITLEGVVQHLDGVTFEARIRPGDDKALSPLQTITLHNIRAKVSGYYTKKF
ncbi:MAG: DUF11 domain-containing protein [Prevotella sp.]|nr:DUF11 domain-containing protein [Bacteroides sp.]MCM1366366.1 DUF11 domain-containing protein [Prevotella sp.]MCM1436276.1 DUF11 domain-containing protein [Prevotella sp.]